MLECGELERHFLVEQPCEDEQAGSGVDQRESVVVAQHITTRQFDRL